MDRETQRMDISTFPCQQNENTAHKIIKGSDCVSELFALGETVMGKYPRRKDMPKAAPRWVKGIYAGKTLRGRFTDVQDSPSTS